MSDDPFLQRTDYPLVALRGKRNGYLQVAPSHNITHYRNLSLSLFQAALGWAQLLEEHGVERVYWITLSEVVPHLHIHLYPRWAADTVKGLALFEQREQDPQPPWTPLLEEVLEDWCQLFKVYMPKTSLGDYR